MLRALVLGLVLANGAFFLWSQGHLRAWGLAPEEQREPERLQRQIAPDSVRLLNSLREDAKTQAAAAEIEPDAENETPQAIAPAVAPQEPTTVPSQPAQAKPLPVATRAASTPAAPVTPALPLDATGDTTCWQAGGFTESQADGLRAALTLLGLPSNNWQLREIRSPARWMIYLGRYENTAQLERKRMELRAREIEVKTVNIPGLAPGLSLGMYPTEATAGQAQQEALRDGISGARVVQAYAESVSYTLRLPAASPAQHSAVMSLGTVLAGKSLRACN